MLVDHSRDAGEHPQDLSRLASHLGQVLPVDPQRHGVFAHLLLGKRDDESLAVAEARGMDPARVHDYLTVGDPDSVCEQLAKYFDAGLDGMIFNMHDAQDLDPVRLAGKTLSAAFG